MKMGKVNKVMFTCTTYKVADSIVLFNHVITVARLIINVFGLLQFTTHETNI